MIANKGGGAFVYIIKHQWLGERKERKTKKDNNSLP
jgi:hypothetical protein